MSDKIYDVPADWSKRALVDHAKYETMYRQSIEDNEGFWREHGKRIDWIKPYTKIKSVSYAPGAVSIKWYEDGTTNIAQNCVDRHLESAATRSRSYGRATIQKTRRRSPIASCMPMSAALPMY